MTGNSDSRLMLLMSVEQCFSIFALFQTASRLSREEFKERLISNILLELLSEPKQELASMKTLDLATCLADGVNLVWSPHRGRAQGCIFQGFIPGGAAVTHDFFDIKRLMPTLGD